MATTTSLTWSPGRLVKAAGGSGSREPEAPAGLGTLGQVKGLVAIQGGNPDYAAQGGLAKGDHDQAMNIVTHPVKKSSGATWMTTSRLPGGPC